MLTKCFFRNQQELWINVCRVQWTACGSDDWVALMHFCGLMWLHSTGLHSFAKDSKVEYSDRPCTPVMTLAGMFKHYNTVQNMTVCSLWQRCQVRKCKVACIDRLNLCKGCKYACVFVHISGLTSTLITGRGSRHHKSSPQPTVIRLTWCQRRAFNCQATNRLQFLFLANKHRFSDVYNNFFVWFWERKEVSRRRDWKRKGEREREREREKGGQLRDLPTPKIRLCWTWTSST